MIICVKIDIYILRLFPIVRVVISSYITLYRPFPHIPLFTHTYSIIYSPLIPYCSFTSHTLWFIHLSYSMVHSPLILYCSFTHLYSPIELLSDLGKRVRRIFSIRLLWEAD
ncbi:hypothetical protein BDB01DRAFT_518701 [Pilobolus umbonatus]|nr:hypothetical protein BDB01DRAFT_518701 [Pilobolus umbonatus]